ncbi:hypothetical protein FRC05_004730 [Tulasnella sp. 425]|nr:hypothetical protein FRC05_004730 [Tulasnella sp. 425]
MGRADPLDAFAKLPSASRLELPHGSPFKPRLAPPSPRSASPLSTSSPLSPGISENGRPSMPLGPDPSLPNNQYYPSSRGLTPSNDYDPYEPSRMSLHTIEIDWSQAYRPSTVVEDIPSRDFSGLKMQWTTIFGARRHRKPVGTGK